MSRSHSPDRRPAVPTIFTIAALAGCLAAPVAFAQSAPSISGTPSITVAPGASYYFRPTARDADGDRLRFSIVNPPPWASFSRRSGRLAGTPTSTGTFPNIVISVSDGTFVTRLPAFQIAVANPVPAVEPPTIGGSPPATGQVGQTYSFTPTASDPGGLPLTFSVASKPAWAGFSATTGTLSGTPATGDVGTYANVTITASNGTARSSLAPFSIAVQGTSLGSVTLSWAPPTTRTDGTPLTNLAGYRVSYGTAPGSYPNSVALNNAGLSTYVVDNLPAGTYYFVITALDANGLESSYSNAATRTVL